MKTSNFSRSQVTNASYAPPMENFSPNDFLISIRDPRTPIKEIVLPVQNILHLAFEDIAMEFDYAIEDWQAELMANFIKAAREKKANLWVNCHAGVSRSGAVVELLGQLGWEIDESIRSRSRVPNHLVFNKLRKFFPDDKIEDLKPLIEYIHDDNKFFF